MVGKPLFLLADSRPLFSTPSVLERALEVVDNPDPAVVYLGASNGDEPNYYGILVAAARPLDRVSCTHVHTPPTDAERECLERAHLIVLSGGDPLRGWHALAAAGTDQILRRRFDAGAVFLGISAGAMQLGSWGYGGQAPVPNLNYLPWIIDVHDERENWARLKQAVKDAGLPGIGIASGSALVYDPADGSLDTVAGDNATHFD